jgi:hypothetical protein
MNLFWRDGVTRHLRAGGGGAGVAPELYPAGGFEGLVRAKNAFLSRLGLSMAFWGLSGHFGRDVFKKNKKISCFSVKKEVYYMINGAF